MFVSLPILIAVLVVMAGLLAMLVRRGGSRRDLIAPPAVRPRWTPPSGAGPAPLPAETEAQVWDLLRDDQAITAIKLVREKTGLGLKEAKDLVDDMRRHDPPSR